MVIAGTRLSTISTLRLRFFSPIPTSRGMAAPVRLETRPPP